MEIYRYRSTSNLKIHINITHKECEYIDSNSDQHFRTSSTSNLQIYINITHKEL
jgi:hypothetical protein